MARGWESKGVEAQQDAAIMRESPATGPPVSRVDADRRSMRKTLELARASAEADLRRASAPAHRTMLEQVIADLDRRLAAIA